MQRSESSLVAILLAQRLVDGDAKPFAASEFWALRNRVEHLKELLGLGVDELVRDTGVPLDEATRIASRLDQATQVAFVLDELEQGGLVVLSPEDDDYPASFVDRLGAAAPPIVHVVGPTELLHRGGLGIVGSRRVSPEGGDVAKSVARAAAERGTTVVSGGAKGVDQLAMTSSVEAGGTAVGVLADSLARLVRDPDTRRAITDGSACLLSPYKPTAGFSVPAAMGRNKLIYALSTTTLVVAADEGSGGTWAGAVEAIKCGYGAVRAWTGHGSTEGNHALVRQGAQGVATIDDALAPNAVTRSEAVEQLTFDV